MKTLIKNREEALAAHELAHSLWLIGGNLLSLSSEKEKKYG